MTQQQLRELIKASNPVSTPARLLPQDQDVRTLFEEVTHRTGNPQPSADPLEQPVERRRDMQTQEKPIQIVPKERSSRPRRRLVPTLAGAMAVIVITVGAWALTRSTETVVANPTPLEVTNLFNEAVSSADWPALRALFTDTSTQQFILPTETIPLIRLMDPIPLGGDLTSLGLFDWNGDETISEFDGLVRRVSGRYAGATTTLLSCAQVDAVTVVCDEVLEGYAFKNPLHMRTWTFTIADGSIANVVFDFSLSEASPIDADAVAVYEAWVMGNRPELTRDLFTFGGELRIEPDTIEIHRQLVTEWQAQQ